MNDRNPDQGIETWDGGACERCGASVNDRNPDQGIETTAAVTTPEPSRARVNDRNPDQGIETLRTTSGEDGTM